MMFDFTCYISRLNDQFHDRTRMQRHPEYLEGIAWEEDYVEGKHFSLDLLKHKGSLQSYYAADGDVKLLLLGSVFHTLAANASETNSKPVSPGSLIAAYRKTGPGFISDYKGMFLLAVLDEETDRYLFYSGKNGLYDLYYSTTPCGLIISTSVSQVLNHPAVTSAVDPVALIQHSVFDYPLGERSLFEGVLPLPPGSYLQYDLSSATIVNYHDYLPALQREITMSMKESAQHTPVLFNRIVDQLAYGYPKLCASLTSGFDSRTNLSRLFNLENDILYYSWGLPGSVEISIPEKIASVTGIRYEPVFLSDEFAASYDYYGKQAVYWSNGRSTIRRANHTYGYSKLSKHAPAVITGLFGSELLRPTNAVGHVFNQAFIDVLYSSEQETLIASLYDSEIAKGHLNGEMLVQNRSGFIGQTTRYFRDLGEKGEHWVQLYYFMLTEGFRKYFGHEIQSCRPYMTVLSPYIDDEFVDFILKTPIPALNRYAFKRNPKSLKLGQSFYLSIISRNLPVLMKIPTGRFYSPAQLASSFYPLTILPGYFQHLKRKRKKNDTFNNRAWNKAFQNANQELMSFSDHRFNSLNETGLQSSDTDLAKQLSLRFWLNLVKK